MDTETYYYEAKKVRRRSYFLIISQVKDSFSKVETSWKKEEVATIFKIHSKYGILAKNSHPLKKEVVIHYILEIEISPSA